MSAMLPLLPSASGNLDALPNTAIPPPLYLLSPLKGDQGPIQNGPEIGISDLSISNQAKDSLREEADSLEDGWVWAKLVDRTRATAEGWEQDVREIELELEDQAS